MDKLCSKCGKLENLCGHADTHRLTRCVELEPHHAVVDMRALETDIMDIHQVYNERWPSIEQLNNRERMREFVRLTKKYIVEHADLDSAKSKALDAEILRCAKAYYEEYKDFLMTPEQDDGTHEVEIAFVKAVRASEGFRKTSEEV